MEYKMTMGDLIEKVLLQDTKIQELEDRVTSIENTPGVSIDL